jgi:hypothetical protein
MDEQLGGTIIEQLAGCSRKYDWDAPGAHPEYKARLHCVSAKMFEAMGIARDDGRARMAAMLRNKTNFDAPACCSAIFPRSCWSRNGRMSACGCKPSRCCCARKAWTAVFRNSWRSMPRKSVNFSA